MQDKAREIVMHQSANRPHLMLGGDREMVLLSMLIGACLAFSVATWWGVLAGLVFWWGSVAVLQRMGKADPLLRHVYLRHIRYAAFYNAKSRVGLGGTATPKSWR
jgi:type IV secretion system protein VirB3